MTATPASAALPYLHAPDARCERAKRLRISMPTVSSPGLGPALFLLAPAALAEPERDEKSRWGDRPRKMRGLANARSSRLAGAAGWMLVNQAARSRSTYCRMPPFL